MVRGEALSPQIPKQIQAKNLVLQKGLDTLPARAIADDPGKKKNWLLQGIALIVTFV